MRVQRARRLRKESTIPERKLWFYLRNRKLGGVKFRRQHPIGQFIVDFFCSDANLIVEGDGDSHDEQTHKYDMRRQAYLEDRGYWIIRVTNDDVLDDAESVALGKRQNNRIEDISDLM